VVAVGGQKQILLYHSETLEPLGVLPFPEGFPAILRFSRNGELLLTGGGLGGKSGKVALWKIATGERVATLGDEFDQVLAADVSADQQFVALGGPNKIVKLYSTADGRLITSIKKHTDWVTALAFSPDGKFLASADRAGGIHVWEGATGREFTSLPGHKAMVTAVAFMPGVLASASEDGRVVLWDVKEGKESRAWNAHAGGATWVDFAADGRLVSCGRDKVAKVWDATGKQLGATKPFSDIALRAALSSDRVIAGDWTGKIRVSALDGKPLGELSSNPPALADRIAESRRRLAEMNTAVARAQAAVAVAEEKRARDSAAEARAAEEFIGPVWKNAGDSPSVVEAVKAKEGFHRAAAELATTRAELQRWELAQRFQTVHEARQTLQQKRAEHEGLAAVVKSATEAAVKARTEVADAEKSAADLRALVSSKERTQLDSTAAIAPAKRAVVAMELALAELGASARTGGEESAPELLGKTSAAEPDTMQLALNSITDALEKARAAFRATEDKAARAAREEADAKAAAEQAHRELGELGLKAGKLEEAAAAERAAANKALATAARDLAEHEQQTKRLEAEYTEAKAARAAAPAQLN
jgi:hypothetical protein